MKTNTKFNIISILVIIIFGIAITPVVFQNDIFYTIKIGEYIFNNGIDHLDHFSWHENLPYTYPHWLYDLITYLVYNIWNYTGIYVATIILSCVLGITLYITNKKLNKTGINSLIITLISMFLLQDFITARAQLVTFILFILTFFFIEKFLETKKFIYGIILIGISLVIANTHIAVWPFFFILFLPYIGEYVISIIRDYNIFIPKVLIKLKKKKIKKIKTEEKKAKTEEKILKLEKYAERATIANEKMRVNSYKIDIVKNHNVKWLIIIMLVCVFTGLLTPIGDVPYTYLVKTMQGNTTKNINEHLPLTLIENIEFLGLITVFVAIIGFTDTKVRLKDIFFIGGLLLLAFISRRQTSIFILICSYMLCNLITSFVNKYSKGALEKADEIVTTKWGQALLLILAIAYSIYMIEPKLDDDYVSKSSYPVEATKYIKENLDIENMRLYNEYNYGSYLLLNDIPVFIDSRADLYSPEFNGGKDIFSDFLNINNIGTYYEEKMSEYKITHVILYKGTKINMFLSRDDNYTELYKDEYFVIYKRNTSNDNQDEEK